MSQETAPISNIFTAHPHSIGESYFEHMLFALQFSGLLLFAGFAALVHALLPFCFEKTAGNILVHLVERMQVRELNSLHV